MFKRQQRLDSRYHATSESLYNTNSRKTLARSLFRSFVRSRRKSHTARKDDPERKARRLKSERKKTPKHFHSLIAIKAISRLVYQVRKLHHRSRISTELWTNATFSFLRQTSSWNKKTSTTTSTFGYRCVANEKNTLSIFHVMSLAEKTGYLISSYYSSS